MDAAPASAGTAQRLPLLDGMRGIAALVVLFYHAWMIHLVGPIAGRGYLFVDFFFLLSGFVLTLSAEPKLRQGLSAAAFIVRRVRRLWPVMAVGTLIVALSLAWSGGLMRSLSLVVMALLLLPSLGRKGLVFPLNGPEWSLLLELIANVAHAVVLVRLGRRALTGVLALSGAALAYAILAYGSNEFGMSGGVRWGWGLARGLFSYTVGVFLARERQAGRRLGRLRCHWAAGVLLPLLVVLSLPALPLPIAVGDIVTTLFILPACFALAINAELPKQHVPLFHELGLISYPLYALHLPIMTFVSGNASPWTAAWLGPVAAVLAAAGLARLLETPKRRRRAVSGELPLPGSLNA